MRPAAPAADAPPRPQPAASEPPAWEQPTGESPPREPTTVETPATEPLPPSDLLERLPDDFWADRDDAPPTAPEPSVARAPAAPAPTTTTPAAPAPTATASTGPASTDADDERGAAGVDPLALVQRLFPGRVLRIEPRDAAASPSDDGAAADEPSGDGASADATDTPAPRDG